MENIMIKFRIFIAALGVALTVASAPALAQSRAAHLGYAARAQAIEAMVTPDGVSRERAKALAECNALAAPFKDYTWGSTQSDLYRSCMTQHGQPE
jgi:hypothetical protein